MKSYVVSIIVLFYLPIIAICQSPAPLPAPLRVTVTKLFIVRHADRQMDQDLLSPAGVIGAAELSRILGKAGIDSIFSTNTVRTKNTAKPLAALRGLPTIIYASDTAVITRILTKSRGKRVLVIGHSNTVATMIKKCGCTPAASIDPIPDTQFDNLFLVIVKRQSVNGVTTSTCETIHMKYGAVTN
ncbi:MAG: phosphoglycerate mutase family protein [Chitinophagaceae bacterium]